MGWAQGLQSGMALGNLINQGFDRRELADEAKKYRVDEVVPEQGKVDELVSQRDTVARGLIDQGVDPNQAYQQATQQLLPQFQETSQSVGLGKQYAYGGQNYADRGEAERAMTQGRTQGMANVYRAQGNEEQASALEARAMQNRAAGLQVKGLEQADKEATRMQSFESDFNQLENKNDMDAIRSLASKHNLSRSQQFTVASQMSGIEKAELEMMDTYVKKTIRGKDLDGMLDIHKNDKKFADGTHFVKAVGDKGQVILNLVSDADPTKVLRTESFTNADLATAYLRKQAEDPGMVAEWSLGVRAAESKIKASEASIRASDAQAASASRTANKPDWMSAVDSKGTLQLVDRNKLSVKEGVAELPKGLKPVSARAEYTAADALKLSDQLIGQTNPNTNKPYTPEEAVAESKRILSGAQDPFMAKLDAVLGGSGDPFAKNAPKDKGKEGLSAEPTTVKTPPEGRFIRQKNNRGAYTYTSSPRGNTKAEFAEIDRNRK